MSLKYQKSDEINFNLERLTDRNGNLFIRVNIPVKQKDFNHNFFVHFRKKGEVQWHSSPLIRQTNFIDMHGLDPNFIYEIRIAVLSKAKEISTFDDLSENVVCERQENYSKSIKFSSLYDLEIASKIADKILIDVFKYLNYSITDVSRIDYH